MKEQNNIGIIKVSLCCGHLPIGETTGRSQFSLAGLTNLVPVYEDFPSELVPINRWEDMSCENNRASYLLNNVITEKYNGNPPVKNRMVKVTKKYKERLLSPPHRGVWERLPEQRRPGAAEDYIFTITILFLCSLRGKFARYKCITSPGLAVFSTKRPSGHPYPPHWRGWEGLLNKGGTPMK